MLKILKGFSFKLKVGLDFKSEDLTQLFLFLIIKSRITNLFSIIDLIEIFVTNSSFKNPCGYYLNIFKLALKLLINK